MFTLPQAVASNERIASTLPKGRVAVFVGGTSGVGEYTVKALAKYAVEPRVYIVGRSKEAASRIVEECRKLNATGKFEFIQADISLLKVVDSVCEEIKSKEKKINLLFESQGSVAYSKTTSEGLPVAATLYLHLRLRFIQNLLPLIRAANTLRRVVCVGAATCEGPIDMTNPMALGFSLYKTRDQLASVGTLMLQEVAKQAPNVGFIHNVPGLVRGGITRDAEGWGLNIFIGIFKIFNPLLETPPAESGERQLYMATSAMFASRSDSKEGAGVSLEDGLVAARECNGLIGSGMYSVDNQGNSASPEKEKLLAQFKEDGTADQIWEYISKDMERATGKQVA